MAGTGKFLCIGLNYADHARESGMEPPAEPVVFMKATSAICGPNDDVEIPRGSKKTDWEVELGVVIGETAKYVDQPTGTPPGVGLGKNPPRYLGPGQTIRLGIEGLGEQEQRTVAAR